MEKSKIVQELYCVVSYTIYLVSYRFNILLYYNIKKMESRVTGK
jgi:hypothetical protein